MKFFLCLIIGAIAAIAVAPQMAVPEDSNKPKELLMLNILASNIPMQNIAITNKETCRKNSDIKLMAEDEDIVKPIIIIPV